MDLSLQYISGLFFLIKACSLSTGEGYLFCDSFKVMLDWVTWNPETDLKCSVWDRCCAKFEPSSRMNKLHWKVNANVSGVTLIKTDRILWAFSKLSLKQNKNRKSKEKGGLPNGNIVYFLPFANTRQIWTYFHSSCFDYLFIYPERWNEYLSSFIFRTPLKMLSEF